VRQIVARPRHPQTLGKIERFWGTLWRECVQEAIFRGIDDAQWGTALRMRRTSSGADHDLLASHSSAAQAGDTIVVADGVYRGAGYRDLRFGGLAITVRSANGPGHCTIDCEGTPAVPYRGLVFDGYETPDSVLEGFTITGGATLPGAIQNQFNGAGILIQAASPTIRNCRFVANHAGCWGGAIYVGDSHDLVVGPASPLIENCVFEGNLADDEGGGLFTWGMSLGGRVTLRNSVLRGNVAGAGGGGVTCFGGTRLWLDHVTLIDNLAGTGANAWIGDATVTSSILWGASDAGLTQWTENSISYSLVRGGAPGVGNLDLDPLFKPDGFHLHRPRPACRPGHRRACTARRISIANPARSDRAPTSERMRFPCGTSRSSESREPELADEDDRPVHHAESRTTG
jgi:hypothetical protein